MGEILYICESCEKHAAKTVVVFPADRFYPEDTYKVCNRCAFDFDGEMRPL